jgi:hypothetical protein
MTATMRVPAGEPLLARHRLSCTGGEAAIEPAAFETHSAARLLALADAWRGLDLIQRLAAIRSHISGRIVFTTSFGLEDQATGYAICSTGRASKHSRSCARTTFHSTGCTSEAFCRSAAHHALARSRRANRSAPATA